MTFSNKRQSIQYSAYLSQTAEDQNLKFTKQDLEFWTKPDKWCRLAGKCQKLPYVTIQKKKFILYVRYSFSIWIQEIVSTKKSDSAVLRNNAHQLWYTVCTYAWRQLTLNGIMSYTCRCPMNQIWTFYDLHFTDRQTDNTSSCGQGHTTSTQQLQFYQQQYEIWTPKSLF